MSVGHSVREPQAPLYVTTDNENEITASTRRILPKDVHLLRNDLTYRLERAEMFLLKVR